MPDVPISFCLTFNENLWIWPKFRTFHVIYKICPDGNFESEKEDMSGKIRTYGSPIFSSTLFYKVLAVACRAVLDSFFRYLVERSSSQKVYMSKGPQVKSNKLQVKRAPVKRSTELEKSQENRDSGKIFITYKVLLHKKKTQEEHKE